MGVPQSFYFKRIASLYAVIADAISNYTARRVATCSWQRSM